MVQIDVREDRSDNHKMYNPEKLATQDTQDTEQRQTKQKA